MDVILKEVRSPLLHWWTGLYACAGVQYDISRLYRGNSVQFGMAIAAGSSDLA